MNRSFLSNCRFSQLVNVFVITLLILAGTLTLSKNSTDPDLWGHVRYGMDALQHGLPTANTYSYTATGHPWINHEVLSEYAMALAVSQWGPRSLLLAKCLLGLSILACIVHRAERTGVRQATLFLITLAVGLNLMHFWSIRPQIFSYVFFTLMVYLLDRAFRGWEGSWRLPRPVSWQAGTEMPAVPSWKQLSCLLLLPLLFFIWANTHGAFVAGWCLMVAYLGCRGIELLTCRHRAAIPQVAFLALIVLASASITMLNPYGVHLHTWLLQSLGSPRPEIVEWRPPELFSTIWLPFWALAAVAVLAIVAHLRKTDFTHAVLLALTLWQAIDHRRHIPFFAILCGYWLAPQLQRLFNRWQHRDHATTTETHLAPAFRPVLLMGLLVSITLVSSGLLGQLRMISVRKDCYPVSAFQYMADRQLRGNLVLRFSWAQYAIATFGDEQDPSSTRVAFDGRFRTCYPQPIVDMYFDFALGEFESNLRHRQSPADAIDGGRILEFRSPDLCLIDRNQGNMVDELTARQNTWSLLYRDELAELWGRSAKYDVADSPDYLPPAHRSISDEPQTGAVAWPAFPAHHRIHLSRRGQPQHANNPPRKS